MRELFPLARDLHVAPVAAIEVERERAEQAPATPAGPVGRDGVRQPDGAPVHPTRSRRAAAHLQQPAQGRRLLEDARQLRDVKTKTRSKNSSSVERRDGVVEVVATG